MRAYGTGIADQILYMDKISEKVQRLHNAYKPPGVELREKMERYKKREKVVTPEEMERRKLATKERQKRYDANRVRKQSGPTLREKSSLKREWTIENKGVITVITGPFGFPYSQLVPGDEVWIGEEDKAHHKFKLRNHRHDAFFTRRYRERDGKVFLVVRRES